MSWGRGGDSDEAYRAQKCRAINTEVTNDSFVSHWRKRTEGQNGAMKR